MTRFQDRNGSPRSCRCAAAARPTGPAPITTTGRAPACPDPDTAGSVRVAGSATVATDDPAVDEVEVVTVSVVGPQQPAPASSASALAAGSQQAPACSAASALPQHGPPAGGAAVVPVGVTGVQQPPVAASAVPVGVVSFIGVCSQRRRGGGVDAGRTRVLAGAATVRHCRTGGSRSDLCR